MGQLFKPEDTYLFRFVIIAGIILFSAAALVLDLQPRLSLITGVDGYPAQDIPFSHEHHVREIGIACLFCHTSVEKSSFAGIPATQTCMKCHRVIFKEAPMLAPVRESFKTGKPVVWRRVYALPDFVYFDHSIHISKGVSCVTCHGDTGGMPFIRKNKAFFMGQCLECHRDPDQYLSADGGAAGSAIAITEVRLKEAVTEITNCSTCHR
jgi:hypothetical protein